MSTATDALVTGATPHIGTKTGPAGLASGKVTAVKDGKITFVPANTNYELELVCRGYAGPVNKPVKGTIRVQARKIWTVPSGGNFITPIFGPPKIIQGRVRALESRWLVVHAGAPMTVEFPESDIIFDLADGAIAQGVLVNVTAFAGGTFELAA